MMNGEPTPSKDTECTFPCPCCGKKTTPDVTGCFRRCLAGCLYGFPGHELPPEDFVADTWYTREGTPRRQGTPFPCATHGQVTAFSYSPSVQTEPAPANYACPCCWLSTTPMEDSSRRKCPGGCNFAGWSGAEREVPLRGLGTIWWKRFGSERGEPYDARRGKIFHCSAHGLVTPWTPRGLTEVTPQRDEVAALQTEAPKPQVCPRCTTPTSETRYPGNEPICTTEGCDGRGFPIWFLKPHSPTAKKQDPMASVGYRLAKRIGSIPSVTINGINDGVTRVHQDVQSTYAAKFNLGGEPFRPPACIHQQAGGIHECVCRKATQCDLTIYCDSE